MNELTDIEQLTAKCGLERNSVQLVTQGQFYKPEYTTYKFRFEAPSTSMVDVSYFSLIIGQKGKKLKFYPLIKAAPQGYLLEFQKMVETTAKEKSLEYLLQQLATHYDTYLLKFYGYFQRYQSVDQTGSTCLRYYFKKEDELPDALRVQNLKSESSKQPEVSEPTSQLKLIPVSPANDDGKQQEAMQQSQESATTNTTQPQLQVSYRQVKTSFKLYDEREIKSIDDFYAEVQEIKQAANKVIQQEQQQPSDGVENAEPQETQQPMQINKFHVVRDDSWTEQNANVFTRLVRGIGASNISQNLIRLCRRFSQLEISLADAESLTFSIDVPLSCIPFRECPNLQLFSTMFKCDLYSLPFVFGINIAQPKKSIIRIDPTGSILTKIIQHSRKVPADIAYSMDYCNFQFLSILSRELTGILRLAPGDLPNDSPTARTQIQTGDTKIEVFQPRARRAITANKASSSDPVTESQYSELISQLPAQFQVIPYYALDLPICRNLDLMFELFYDISKYAAEGLRRQHVQEVIQQQLDSSGDEAQESSEDSYEYDSEEGEETSSSDSIYDAYASITSQFLIAFDPQQQVPAGMRMHLVGLELDNAMILQFQKVMVSVYCTKCTKMNIVTLDSEIPPIKQCYSDLLTGTELCKSCKMPLTLHLLSRLFNSASVNISGVVEPLFVLKHLNCIPSSLAYFEQSCIIIQCECGTLSLQNQLKVFYGRNGQGCVGRCPVCFKRLSIQYQNQFFALANGQQIRVQNQNGGAKTAKQIKATPLVGDGTCKHYPRSYRFFRFACGQAFPCDVCHEQNCDCGDELAKTMICGFCGKSQPVSDVCVKCRKNLTKQRGTHWEGGEGCRDRGKMSKKDDKKYRGAWKTRSKANRKRTAMQKRGNAKKKPEDVF